MRWQWLWLAATAATAAPVVYWHSAPVRPGQVVAVVGGGWSDNPRVELAPLPRGLHGPPGRGQAVTLLAHDDANLQFELPAGEVDLWEARIDGQPTFVANLPELWWAQVVPSTSGDQIALAGRFLPADGAVVELRASQQTMRIPLALGRYQARFERPAALSGACRLRLHRGVGGERGWSNAVAVTLPEAAPPPASVELTTFGARGDGAHDDTAPLRRAIAAAGEKGGVVRLGRGRYLLTETLELPPGVALEGEGPSLTALLWPDRPDPLPAQVRGTHHFALRNLSLYCSNYQHVVVGATTPEAGWGDVTIENVRIRANPYHGHLKPEEVDTRFRASLRLSTGGGDTVRVGGPRVVIRNCDLYGAGRVLFLSGVSDGVVTGNRLTNGRWGWYCLSGSNRLIFTDNQIRGGDLMSTGGGLNCLYGYTNSQNVLYAGNSLADMHGWDREAMTSDAGGGAYFGKAASCEGATVTLAEPISAARKDSWAGAALFVVEGRGRGQFREVVAASGRTVTLAQPFDPVPDTGSQLSLTMLQRRYLLIDNRFSDAGIGIQLYGTAVEHVIDGNTTARAGGLHGQARRYTTGIQPEIGIQFLNCTVEEGLSYRYDANNTALSGPSRIGLHAFAPARLMGGVIRDCVIKSHGQLEVKGGGGEPLIENVVVEGNHVAESELGLVVDGGARLVTVRGNRFTRVGREVLNLADLEKEWRARQAALLADPGPLARWSFEQAGGGGAEDDTGRGLTARRSGTAAFEPGLRGQALRPGESGWLEVGTESSFEAAVFNLATVTVSAWIRPDRLDGRYGIVSKRSANQAAPFILSMQNGQPGFEATDAAGKWSYNLQGPKSLVAEAWQQVTAVAVGGQGVTLYVNGQEVARKNAAAPIAATVLPLRIGWDAWGGARSDPGQAAIFPGLIDEVCIWGRALSAAEVAAEYARLKP